MKTYSKNDIKLMALEFVLDKLEKDDVMELLSIDEINSLKAYFPTDPEPVIPNVNERLSLIEKMIMAEGTAMQKSILEEIAKLNDETGKQEKLHKEWEAVIDSQREIQNEYVVSMTSQIQSLSRNILEGVKEIWVEEPDYNEEGGFYTITPIDFGETDPKDFWLNYITSKIDELKQ